MSRRNGLAIDTDDGAASQPQGTRAGPRRSAGSFLFTPNNADANRNNGNQLGGLLGRERDRGHVNGMPGHSPSASSAQGRAF